MAEVLERPLLLSNDMEALRKIRQPELFLSLQKDLAMVSPLIHFICFLSCFFVLFLTFSFVFYVQAIQEVSVVEEWFNDAWNEARFKAKLHAEANRDLGAYEHKNKELTNKLTTVDRAHLSVVVDLKNAEIQAED